MLARSRYGVHATIGYYFEGCDRRGIGDGGKGRHRGVLAIGKCLLWCRCERFEGE